MSEFPILPSSDKAKLPMRSGIGGSNGNIKFPFAALEVGQSFAVPFENAVYLSLKSNVSQKNKKAGSTGKLFRVIKHGDTIEVARIQ